MSNKSIIIADETREERRRNNFLPVRHAVHPTHWRGHRYDEDGICRCGAQIEDTWFNIEPMGEGEE